MFNLHVSIFQFLVLFCQVGLQQIVRKIRGPPARTEEDVRDKVVVITGANSGLGKCTALEMSKRGAVVVMTCRNLTKGIEARNEIRKISGSHKIELVEMDLSDMHSVRKCASQISSKYRIIDILINNAGIAIHSPTRQLTPEGNELHFATNYLGHFMFTNLLLDNIKKSKAGRIVNVSSSALVLANFSINDLSMDHRGMGIGNLAPYSNSKFANALFTKELGERLAGSNVTTFTLCPGLVNTYLSQAYYSDDGLQNRLVQGVLSLVGLSVEDGADGILYCALAKGISHTSGQMYRFGRVLTSVSFILTDSLAKELWKESEKLVRIK